MKGLPQGAYQRGVGAAGRCGAKAEFGDQARRGKGNGAGAMHLGRAKGGKGGGIGGR